MEGVWKVGEEVGGGSAHSAVESVGINYSAKMFFNSCKVPSCVTFVQFLKYNFLLTCK